MNWGEAVRTVRRSAFVCCLSGALVAGVLGATGASACSGASTAASLRSAVSAKATKNPCSALGKAVAAQDGSVPGERLDPRVRAAIVYEVTSNLKLSLLARYVDTSDERRAVRDLAADVKDLKRAVAGSTTGSKSRRAAATDDADRLAFIGGFGAEDLYSTACAASGTATPADPCVRLGWAAGARDAYGPRGDVAWATDYLDFSWASGIDFSATVGIEDPRDPSGTAAGVDWNAENFTVTPHLFGAYVKQFKRAVGDSESGSKRERTSAKADAKEVAGQLSLFASEVTQACDQRGAAPVEGAGASSSGAADGTKSDNPTTRTPEPTTTMPATTTMPTTTTTFSEPCVDQDNVIVPCAT
jgi:hypothetical protein